MLNVSVSTASIVAVLTETAVNDILSKIVDYNDFISHIVPNGALDKYHVKKVKGQVTKVAISYEQ